MLAPQRCVVVRRVRLRFAVDATLFRFGAVLDHFGESTSMMPIAASCLNKLHNVMLVVGGTWLFEVGSRFFSCSCIRV